MGKTVRNKTNKIGITFIESNGRIAATVSLKSFSECNGNIEKTLTWAAKVYKKHLDKMKQLIKREKELLNLKEKVPATLMWDLGNEIFELVNTLSSKNLQFENLYERLTSDLEISRTTIKRTVIFRRYLPNRNIIPADLNWSEIIKSSIKTEVEKLLSKKKINHSKA
ncbi:MAG: hypothetical protein QW051_03415 [Candidatus Aenigmatarchaeota archaeon]